MSNLSRAYPRSSPLTPFSMGTAWRESSAYPWETARYVSGIEVIKVNITLRIYSAKYHVYAGLALLNPVAATQIKEYARSVTELFKLMLENKGDELRERVWRSREKVFGWTRDQEGGADTATAQSANGESSSGGPSTSRRGDRKPLISVDILDQFSLGNKSQSQSQPSSQTQTPTPNSHLSLLAMVDCWANLSIRPFEHLDVAGTPVFMLWIGVAEYLFGSRALVENAIKASLSDNNHRRDDMEFCIAARGWSECVSFGNFDLYARRFQETAGECSVERREYILMIWVEFFSPRFDEATKLGGRMIKAIQESQKQAS